MRHDEDDLQAAVCDYLSLLEAKGDIVGFFAVPNGGRRNKREAARLKRTGTRAGVPDLVVLRHGGSVLFVEMKTPTGRLRPNQREWLERLGRGGFQAEVCRSIDDVASLVGSLNNC